MILLDDLQTMIFERPVVAETGKNYQRSIKSFGAFLGRLAHRSDLVESTVNQFIAFVSQGRAPTTAAAYKHGLTILWNWLAEQDFVRPYDPRRLRKIQETIQPPRPFSLSQVQLLLEAASMLDHRCNYGTAAEMMRAWILVGYETGLRPGDLRRLTPADLRSNNVLTIAQNKTGQPHSFSISSLAREALLPVLASKNATIFPPTKHEMDRWNKRLIKVAEENGLSRRKRQGIGTLRKTHGTEICRVHGLEVAARSLGHVSGTKMARKHYVEPQAIAVPPPPPSIFEAINDNPANNRISDSNH
jgi:integrase